MRLEKIKRDDIPAVLCIANECVGENLYTADDFLSVFRSDWKYLLVLRNSLGTIVGYIFFLITSTREIELSTGGERGKLGSLSRCGRIQSVALKEEYRGRGYSEKMINTAIEIFLENEIDTVFIVCWKPGGVLPLKKALGRCGFSFTATVKEAWYSSERLFCPYCHGRCHCDADIYCKKLIED